MIPCLRKLRRLNSDLLPVYDDFADAGDSVNSKAAFLIMKEAAKVVEEGGKIITIVTSLLAAFTGFYTSYAGSKAPVEHFTRGVAKELSSRRISVNAIGPGPMDTRTSLLRPDRIYCRPLLTTRRNLQHSSTLKNPMTLLRSTSPWRWRVV